MHKDPIYVASRASVPERPAMWRKLRAEGWNIVSSWIDEADEGVQAARGEAAWTELWDRIQGEITFASKVVLYAEADDFPLKGALIEVGMALGMRRPVIVCLPGVDLDPITSRPIGSWIKHRNVHIVETVQESLDWC